MDLRISCMQDKARRLLRQPLAMPVAVGAVSLLILIGSARQYHQWQALMVKQDATSTPATASPAPQVINQARIATLFGAPAAPSDSPPQRTDLPLTLLGSFVNARPESSAALIQTDGKPARRVIVGQELVSGVRLAAVATDYLLLERNGTAERLYFPRPVGFAAANDLTNYGASYTTLKTYHLSQLTGVSHEQARQKAQLLKQEVRLLHKINQISM